MKELAYLSLLSHCAGALKHCSLFPDSATAVRNPEKKKQKPGTATSKSSDSTFVELSLKSFMIFGRRFLKIC